MYEPDESEVRRLVREAVERALGPARCADAAPAGEPAPDPPAGAPAPARRVAIGADHGGFELKEAVKALLMERGIPVLDVGTENGNSVD